MGQTERGERGGWCIWFVEALDEGLGCVEGAVYDVDVVDFWAAEEEC